MSHLEDAFSLSLCLLPLRLQIAAIARLRNQLAFATHTFFQQNGFLYVHTPIVTTNDCEGAGEMFQVCLRYTLRCLPDSLCSCSAPLCSIINRALPTSNCEGTGEMFQVCGKAMLHSLHTCVTRGNCDTSVTFRVWG